ncbi:hypothetical protein PPL_08402 [Heterostelium album PN500]|uniref:Centrosomin N-terminal motif 1 domain-containing protein n=1 Tax=Heterostelium pallidum (strain ATCC 26659 / Pp 5 / PN500) TaxID=670386 RepID=D3BI34_HETP5|nr:hypothetical protein PPL_08402 [Heterostelium album PN500]EFA78934.1 hypothetical protein PPL_08402 [Heterostelium album PN500]|eukprot:XP_020431058.1 hypothetical protein PPL_08402 [Heterostelium album PN500]
MSNTPMSVNGLINTGGSGSSGSTTQSGISSNNVGGLNGGIANFSGFGDFLHNIDDNATDQMAQHGITRTSSSTNLEDVKSNLKDLEDTCEYYKKINFSLKMKIYYMEESIKSSGVNQDTIEMNIRIQELTSEIDEKNTLIIKLKNALESLQRQHNELTKSCICDFGKKIPTVVQQVQQQQHQPFVQQSSHISSPPPSQSIDSELLKQQLQQQLQQLQQLQQQLQQSERSKRDDAGMASRRIKELEDALRMANSKLDSKDNDSDSNIQRILNDYKVQVEHIGSLEDAIRKYKREYDNISDKYSQLEKTSGERDRERQRLDSTIEALRANNESLKNSFELLKSNYESLKSKSEALKNQVEKLKTRCLELESLVIAKENELNALREELIAASRHSHEEERQRVEDITALRNQVKRLKERRDQMADEHSTNEAEYRKAVDELGAINASLRTEKNHMQEEIEKNTQVLDSMERSYRELQEEVSGSLKRQQSIEREREIYKQQAEQMAGQLQQLNDRNKKLQTENRQLDQMRNNVREQHQATESSNIDCLREILNKLNIELGIDTTATTQSSTSSADPFTLKNNIIDNINLLQNATSQLLSSTITETDNKLTGQLEQILEVLSEKSTQLEQLERKYENLQPGYLVELVGNSKLEKDRLSEELRNTRNDLESRTSDLQAELAQKNDELTALKRRFNSGIQVPSENNQLLHLRQEISRLQKAHKDSADQLQQASNNQSKLTDEYSAKIESMRFNYEIKVEKMEKEMEQLNKEMIRQQQQAYQQNQQLQQQLQREREQLQQQLQREREQLHLQQQQQQQELQQQQQKLLQTPNSNNNNNLFSSRLAIDTIDLPKTPKTPSRNKVLQNSPQFEINQDDLQKPETWALLRDKFAQLSNDSDIKQEKLKSPTKPSFSNSISTSPLKGRETRESRKSGMATMQQHIQFLQYLLENKQAISSLEQSVPDFKNKMDNALNDIKQMDIKKKLLVYELQERTDKLHHVIDSYNNLVTSTPIDPTKSVNSAPKSTTKSIMNTPTNNNNNNNNINHNHNQNGNNQVLSYKPLSSSQLTSSQWNQRNNQKAVSFNNTNTNNKENISTDEYSHNHITTEPIAPRTSSIRQPMSINGHNRTIRK